MFLLQKKEEFFSNMGRIRFFITCSKSISILTLTENVEYFTSMLINVNILLRKALHVITYKRQYIQLVRPRRKLLCINWRNLLNPQNLRNTLLWIKNTKDKTNQQWALIFVIFYFFQMIFYKYCDIE